MDKHDGNKHMNKLPANDIKDRKNATSRNRIIDKQSYNTGFTFYENIFQIRMIQLHQTFHT